MGKDRVLRRIVLLQAVCMVVLAVVVITRVLAPQGSGKNEGGEPEEDMQDKGSSIAATVGDETITWQEFESRLKDQYGDTVLHTLMARAAIRQEAAAGGLTVSESELEQELKSMMEGYESEERYYSEMRQSLGLTPEEIRDDAKYKLLLEKIATRDIAITEEELEQYVIDQQAQFTTGIQLRLAWIVTEGEQAAEELLEQLEAGAKFDELAASASIDRDTASIGGELGWIEQDDPFFEQDVLLAASSLAPGEVTGPIPVEGGQAIVLLADRKEEKAMSEEAVRSRARKQLALEKAESLQDVEEKLLRKYEAKAMVPGAAGTDVQT
ncbi:peptidylprolyl isomerase [Paenibacillus methanolicus]|uniref:peptidylprolyl isomerase n=1 Tax=Paenibacillus methanolicus TaxID=582686 RepID=A0A5S5BLT1_9BACL|nr:peptidylprolyl isomerase [Paenibacillus methanolicus]TYP68025.1 foldase protein PrsA [Paenibacillus methanolicus]